jgi:hypothetical protein
MRTTCWSAQRLIWLPLAELKQQLLAHLGYEERSVEA